MQFGGSVYILTNSTHSVLYIGVTSDLYARVSEHKEKKYPDCFTAKYNCNKLVYYETFSRIEEAIAKEKTDEEMEQGLEVRSYQQNESTMDRFVCDDLIFEIPA